MRCAVTEVDLPCGQRDNGLKVVGLVPALRKSPARQMRRSSDRSLACRSRLSRRALSAQLEE